MGCTSELIIHNPKLMLCPTSKISSINSSRSGQNARPSVIDEAQNLTPHEIKTIITRAGENTKMIFTGDLQQIDSPYLDSQSNGLAYMIDKMRGQDIFAHINLTKGERSQLSELASNLL